MAKKKKAAKKKAARKKAAKKSAALVCDPPCRPGFECRLKLQPGGTFKRVCVPMDGNGD